MNYKKLEQEIINLPIFLPDKIILALIILQLKPASDVRLDGFRNLRLQNLLGTTKKKLNTIIKFLNQYKLKYLIARKEHGTTISREIESYKNNFSKDEFELIVSYDYKKAKELIKLLGYKVPRDKKIENKLGIIYGFPPAAVNAWSENIHKDSDEFFKVIAKPTKEERLKHFWMLYKTYAVRKGFENTDSQLAIKWATAIRTNFPLLAKQYEENAKKQELK